jgi:hypothetical protein
MRHGRSKGSVVTYPLSGKSAMLARILIFVVGSLLLAFGIFSWSQDLTDRSQWASVEGRVLESNVNSYSGSHGRGRRYRLTVRYEYEVGGLRWVSANSVANGTDPYSIEQIQRSIFPINAKVLVYYDPKDPKRAVLDNRPAGGIQKGADVFLICLGSLGILAACFGKGVRVSWKS